MAARSRRRSRRGAAALGAATAVTVVLWPATPAFGTEGYRETVGLDAARSTRSSTEAVLLPGREYRLDVIGTYRTGDTIADAECARAGLAPTFDRGSRDGGFDVLVDGIDIDWLPVQRDLFGCDSTGHAYTGTVRVPVERRVAFRLDIPQGAAATGRIDITISGDEVRKEEEAAAAPTPTESEPATTEPAAPPPPADAAGSAGTAGPAPAAPPVRRDPSIAPTPPAAPTAAPPSPAPAPARAGDVELDEDARQTLDDLLGRGDPPKPEVALAAPVTSAAPATPAAQDAGSPLPLVTAVVGIGAVAAAAVARQMVQARTSRPVAPATPTPTLVVRTHAASQRLAATAACDCGYCER